MEKLCRKGPGRTCPHPVARSRHSHPAKVNCEWCAWFTARSAAKAVSEEWQNFNSLQGAEDRIHSRRPKFLAGACISQGFLPEFLLYHMSSLHLKPFLFWEFFVELGFFPLLKHHLQAFVSTYLSASQTLRLNLVLSSPLWSPVCDDSDLEPKPLLSLRNCSTYLSNSSEIIWIQHVLLSLLSKPHDFHFSLASSSFSVPVVVCCSFSFFWVSPPQSVTQSDIFRYGRGDGDVNSALRGSFRKKSIF